MKGETVAAVIHHAGTSTEVTADNQTVLDAIQKLNIEFSAPCGGNGTCKKCQVPVRDASGLHTVLACQTKLADVMDVFVEDQAPMVVQESGSASHFEGKPGANGYGISVDVGTTTMVCRLHRLSDGTLLATAGQANPQGVYGADVISRISASVDGHLDDMCDLLLDSLSSMIDTVCKKVGVNRSEIVDAVLVGNTTMENIAARLAPDSIGVAPFEPLSKFGTVEDLSPFFGATYLAPCQSGYVGGDITAGILATRMYEAEKPIVFLDLGTNGELAVGNRDRIVSCATAAGPVFEGAGIYCGMSARPGAISKVRAGENPGELELTVLGDVDPEGICGTGLVEGLAFLLEQGIILPSGAMAKPGTFEGPLGERIVERDGMPAFLLDADHDVFISQADVRKVQMAKGAIEGGILTILDECGIQLEDVGEMLIAGGFGSFLSVDAAAAIGLFPRELRDRARSVGNSAIEGASLMLLSDEARATTQLIADTSEYVELSTSSKFYELYMTVMTFDK